LNVDFEVDKNYLQFIAFNRLNSYNKTKFWKLIWGVDSKITLQFSHSPINISIRIFIKVVL